MRKEDAMELILSIPWPPTENKIWRTSRSMMYSSEKYKQFSTLTFLMVKQQLPRTFEKFAGPVRVTLDLYPPTRQSYDIDNRIKPTLDALTKSAVWEDDDQVVELIVRKRSVVKRGKAEVRIEEVNNE